MAALPNADELVRRVMELTGSSSPTELARALRMEGFWAPQNVTRWMKGTTKPDYDSTLTLLAAAGMLNLEAPATRSETEPSLRDVLDELRALDRKIDTLNLPETVRQLESAAERIRDSVE